MAKKQKNIFDLGAIPTGIDSTLGFPSSGSKKGKGKGKNKKIEESIESIYGGNIG